MRGTCPSERGRVRLDIRQDAAFVTVRVRDSGPRIAQNDLVHGFERLHRGGSGAPKAA